MQIPLTISENQEAQFVQTCLIDEREFSRIQSKVNNTVRYLVNFRTLSDIFYFGVQYGIDVLHAENNKK